MSLPAKVRAKMFAHQRNQSSQHYGFISNFVNDGCCHQPKTCDSRVVVKPALDFLNSRLERDFEFLNKRKNSACRGILGNQLFYILDKMAGSEIFEQVFQRQLSVRYSFPVFITLILQRFNYSFQQVFELSTCCVVG